MSIKTDQIVKILQLKGLGRKSALKMCDIAEGEFIDDDNDLMEFILKCNVDKLISRLPEYSKSDMFDAFKKGNEILKKSEDSGISIVSIYDRYFPSSIKEIPDYPIILNFKGRYKDLNNQIGIAIIGTREPTYEGIKSGEHFGKYYGEKGFNIVSGLAKGCDAAAHRGCLKGNGFTTAILAHGLHTIYPKENKNLAEDILSNGGVLLSEYFIGTGALSNYFIERDRLQAGLSKATIVIQTAIKGGTMHAVNATLKSGKILATVCYKQDLRSEKIEGNKMLIKDKNAFSLSSTNGEELINLINKGRNVVIEETVPEICNTVPEQITVPEQNTAVPVIPITVPKIQKKKSDHTKKSRSSKNINPNQFKIGF